MHDRNLLQAAKRNDLAGVRVALANGATLTELDGGMVSRYNGWNALHWACWHGEFEIVKEILENFSQRGEINMHNVVNSRTSAAYSLLPGGNGRETPLHLVCRRDAAMSDGKIEALLVEYGADIQLLDDRQQNALANLKFRVLDRSDDRKITIRIWYQSDEIIGHTSIETSKYYVSLHTVDPSAADKIRNFWSSLRGGQFDIPTALKEGQSHIFGEGGRFRTYIGDEKFERGKPDVEIPLYSLDVEAVNRECARLGVPLLPNESECISDAVQFGFSFSPDKPNIKVCTSLCWDLLKKAGIQRLVPETVGKDIAMKYLIKYICNYISHIPPDELKKNIKKSERLMRNIPPDLRPIEAVVGVALGYYLIKRSDEWAQLEELKNQAELFFDNQLIHPNVMQLKCINAMLKELSDYPLVRQEGEVRPSTWDLKLTGAVETPITWISFLQTLQTPIKEHIIFKHVGRIPLPPLPPAKIYGMTNWLIDRIGEAKERAREKAKENERIEEELRIAEAACSAVAPLEAPGVIGFMPPPLAAAAKGAVAKGAAPVAAGAR